MKLIYTLFMLKNYDFYERPPLKMHNTCILNRRVIQESITEKFLKMDFSKLERFQVSNSENFQGWAFDSGIKTLFLIFIAKIFTLKQFEKFRNITSVSTSIGLSKSNSWNELSQALLVNADLNSFFFTTTSCMNQGLNNCKTAK